MDVLYVAPEEESLWPADAPAGDISVEWVDSPSALDERLTQRAADCLVVDPRFGDGDLLTLLGRTRELVPDLPFVVYGRGVDDETVRRLYDETGTDYVVRDDGGGGFALARRVEELGTGTSDDRVAGRETDSATRTDSSSTVADTGDDSSPFDTTPLSEVTGDGTPSTAADDSGRPDAADAPVDAAVDAATDATADSPTDATTDTPTDAATGAPTNATADAPTDATTDVATDATTDAPTNATADAPTDAATDATTGAPNDVAVTAGPAGGIDSELEVEAVMNRVTDAFFGLDAEWRVTYLNDRAEELLDRSQEELLHRNFWAEFGEARGSTFQREFENAMATQEPVSFEEYYPPLERWFQVTAYPSETGLSVYFRDVTGAVQTEAERRALHSLTRSLRDASSFEAGLEAAIDAVVEETDWSYGEAWRVDGDDLIQTDAWCHHPVDAVAEETTLETIQTGLETLSVDDAFVARTLTEGRLARSRFTEAGLETAIAIPVTHDGEAVAVLVFGLHVARENIDSLVEAARAAATELSALTDRLEARASHRRRTRQFEAVFHDPATNAVLLDTEGRIVRTNRQTDDGFESLEMEWEGLLYWEHPWWDDADVDEETVREYVDRALDGEYVRFETASAETFARPRVFDVSMRPVFGDDGAAEGVVVGGRDITERKEATRRAEERERQFEAIFQDPDSPVALLDTDGTIVRHNETGQRLAEEMGSGGDMIGDSYWNIPYWEGTRMSETTIRGYVARAADGEYVQFETVNPDAAGELRAFDTSIRPVYDADDGVEALVVESRDVSKRVRADAERRKKEQQFDAMFADPTSSVLLLDETGRIQRANDASFQGFKTGVDLVGTMYWEHPWWREADRGPEEARQFIRRVANGEYIRFETVNETRFDDRVALDVSLRPVYGDDGVVTGIVAEGLDISEQYRLEQDLREERNLTKRILATSPVGIAIVAADGDVEFINARGKELVGSREVFPDEPYPLVTPDGDPVPDSDRPFRRVLESGETHFGMVVGLDVDGNRLWLSVNGAPLDDGERVVLTFEDVTEQRTRTEQLSALATATQSLSAAECPADVAEDALDVAESVVGTTSVAIALFDPDTGGLSPVEGSDATLRDQVDRMADSLGWRAFRSGAPAVEPGRLALPLGDQGVFLVAVDDGIESTTRRLVDLFAANLASELVRADRETALRERSEELVRRTTELERLNRVNDVIRSLTGRLIDAGSREEVEAATCEAFAAAPYDLAWVGQRRVGSDGLDVTSCAGSNAARLEALAEPPASPAIRAIESGTVEVVDDFREDAVPSAWRSFAEERRLRASASVPLDRNGTRYGVLTLFATDADGFGQLEREVLAEMGEMVSYTIASLERRQALASDRSTELVFAFPVEDLRFFPFYSDESIKMHIRSVVSRGDGRAHLFFNVEGVDPETVLEQTSDAPAIDRITRLDSDENGTEPRFEAVLSAGSSTARLLERGFVVHDTEVVGDRLHLTIRSSVDADPREVLAIYEDEYDGVELVAKRTVEGPVRSQDGFEAAYLDSLTSRQEEVLRAAHAAGFFEWPRLNSGQEVADLLEVSQPTVNRHLRESERKLFDQLFDGT